MRKQGYYQLLFATMELLPEWYDRVKRAAEIIHSGFAKYHDVSAKTGIPWQVVGVIHWREADCNWKCNLHNGQRWDRVTTIVPVGVGPFASWQAAAEDAMKRQLRAQRIAAPVTTEQIGRFLERYNGIGYELRGLNSPYLWRGSDYCKGVGKFVERNGRGVYLPEMEAKDQDEGAMVLLRALGWPV